MKKILTLLFIAMPLMALAWGSAEHEYRVTFGDGKIAEPIYTKSYTSNWCEDELEKDESGDNSSKMCCQFYFNEEGWLNKNLDTIEKCGVKGKLIRYRPKMFYYIDGYVLLKDIDKIEQIK